MFKRVKFIAGIALIVQAITSFILFLSFYSKKKSASNTMLIVSCLSGLSGAWLMYDDYRENKYKYLEHCDGCLDDYDDYCCEELFDEGDVDIECTIEDGAEAETADKKLPGEAEAF